MGERSPKVIIKARAQHKNWERKAVDLIELRPIGFVQKVKGEESSLELIPTYEQGLLGIESHKRIFVLYWMHKQKGRSTLQVHPKRDPSKPKVGVFASRSPARPNPIGLCLVELVRRDGNKLTVRGLDALEGTPILDIKPAVGEEVSRAGR